MKKKTISILFMISVLSLINLHSDDSLEDLFGTAEEEVTSPVLSGEQIFLYEIPYVDMDRFETPVFENTFSMNYATGDIKVVSSWNIAIPENTIIPDENYISIAFSRTDIKTGYTLFAWGHADGYNPTDKLNSKDYSDPLDITGIPALAFSLEHYFGSFSAEAVYIPMKGPSVFADFISDSIPATLVDSAAIGYGETGNTEKYVLGGRLNYYGPADLSLSYIYNRDNFYTPEVTFNPDYPGSGLPLSGLTLKNQRIQHIGFSGKTIISRYGLWLEANFSLPETSKDYLEWTAGFDFAFGPESRGLFSMQNTGKWCCDFFNHEYENPMVESLTASLQNLSDDISLGLITRISYQLPNGEWEPHFLCAYMTSLEDGGTVILRPSLTCRPIDSLAIEAGLRLVNVLGESDFYDNVHQNDNLALSITYNW